MAIDFYFFFSCLSLSLSYHFDDSFFLSSFLVLFYILGARKFPKFGMAPTPAKPKPKPKSKKKKKTSPPFQRDTSPGTGR